MFVVLENNKHFVLQAQREREEERRQAALDGCDPVTTALEIEKLVSDY